MLNDTLSFLECDKFVRKTRHVKIYNCIITYCNIFNFHFKKEVQFATFSYFCEDLSSYLMSFIDHKLSWVSKLELLRLRNFTLYTFPLDKIMWALIRWPHWSFSLFSIPIHYAVHLRTKYWRTSKSHWQELYII